MTFKRNNRAAFLHIAIIVMIIAVLFLAVKSLFSSPEEQAENVVNRFYSYEQKGEFSSSWSLFHSAMKDKFGKGHYIQDRAHVFMNHLGVDTFSFKLNEAKKIKDWKMSKEGPPFKTGYQFTVIQTFKGKYGNFDIVQKVFAVKEKGEWKVMWDYNK
jgi:hypothetical protein